MSLLGEEALEEIWNLVKEKIAEEQQKYKYSFENDICKVTILRQINICFMHIAAASDIDNTTLEIPEGFRPEAEVNETVSIKKTSGEMIVKNLPTGQTLSLTYCTSNLLPDDQYKRSAK